MRGVGWSGEEEVGGGSLQGAGHCTALTGLVLFPIPRCSAALETKLPPSQGHGQVESPPSRLPCSASFSLFPFDAVWSPPSVRFLPSIAHLRSPPPSPFHHQP